jgi:hypothetical protein
MNANTLKVLLISDDADDAALIRKALYHPTENRWRLERVRRLSDGVTRLRNQRMAAVLRHSREKRNMTSKGKSQYGPD